MAEEHDLAQRLRDRTAPASSRIAAAEAIGELLPVTRASGAGWGALCSVWSGGVRLAAARALTAPYFGLGYIDALATVLKYASLQEKSAGVSRVFRPRYSLWQ